MTRRDRADEPAARRKRAPRPKPYGIERRRETVETPLGAIETWVYYVTPGDIPYEPLELSEAILRTTDREAALDRCQAEAQAAWRREQVEATGARLVRLIHAHDEAERRCGRTSDYAPYLLSALEESGITTEAEEVES